MSSKRVNPPLKTSGIFFVLMFLVSLVILMPARLGQMIDLPDNVSVSNWAGSIWQGRAGQVAITNEQGQVLLDGKVDWDIQLLSLLQGKLCFLFYAEESNLVATAMNDMAAQVQGQAGVRLPAPGLPILRTRLGSSEPLSPRGGSVLSTRAQIAGSCALS